MVIDRALTMGKAYDINEEGHWQRTLELPLPRPRT